MNGEMTLRPIIKVVEENCVNCHRCISVCPAKMCNDGSGKIVDHHSDLCIGCGECIVACTHGARVGIDDFEVFMADLKKGVPIITIVAPASAASFKGLYLNLNGYLKSLRVKANFDVSLGAELTVKSYLEYIKQANPKTVIAQPCPTLVSFIEMYRPELIPYLAPADSPMMHTMKMIRRFYTEYKDCKIAVISPCYSKRREFDECGLGDYNVTFRSMEDYMDAKGIDIAQVPAVEYDNPPAERAVL
ncbi:MAG: 4Fe-4S binding protein, partial [Treponema sp.]|nr:4Fe-4S binding protein [Treponema sp.]